MKVDELSLYSILKGLNMWSQEPNLKKAPHISNIITSYIQVGIKKYTPKLSPRCKVWFSGAWTAINISKMYLLDFFQDLV